MIPGDRVVLDIPGSATAPVASFDSIPLAIIQQYKNLYEVYLSGAQTVIVENRSPWDVVAMIDYTGASSLFPVVVPRHKSKTVSSKVNAADSLILQVLQDQPLILQSLSQFVSAALTDASEPGYQVIGYIPPGSVTVTGMTDDLTIATASLDDSGATRQWYLTSEAVAQAVPGTGSLLLTGFLRGIVGIDLWNRSDGDLYFTLTGKTDTSAATPPSSGYVDAGRKEIYLAAWEEISMDVQFDPVTTLTVRNPQGVDAGFQYLAWGS